jgi:hypothetical protein
MNLNLHIGYHKTGTTSFQRRVSSLETDKFKYLGRLYSGSDNAVVAHLADAVALNNKSQIIARYNEVIRITELDNNENFLISDENFLRPSAISIEGLKILEDIASKDFCLKLFISTRRLEDLILSRFLHDCRLLKKSELYPDIILTNLLKKALVPSAECNYPYCKKGVIACTCGVIKKIPYAFYSKEFLRDKLTSEILYLNLLSEKTDDQSSRLKLVFGEEKVFPLPVHNKSRFYISDSTKSKLLKVIEGYLANTRCKHSI